MPLETALGAIDFASRRKAGAVQLTGGEPTLYPHLGEVISYCTERGLYSIVASSGIHHSLSFYRDLRERGLTALCLSLNSADRSVNLQTRDHFDCTVQAIRTAVDLGITCFINTVITPESLVTLEDTVC